MSIWKLVTQIFDAHRNPLSSGVDPGLGGEKHVIVADHQQDDFGPQPVNAAMIEPPKDILCLVPADADVDGFDLWKVLRPRLAPLNGDTVADQQDVDRTLVREHSFDVSLMQVQPRIATEETRRRNDRPQLG